MTWLEFKALPLAVLIALAANNAYAQSSVTLYGIIDQGLMFVNNVGGPAGGKRFTLDSTNGINGSRWGMTGKEDLGGGLRAIFTLEGGINVNNGQSAQGNTFLGRQAFVGLSHEAFGSLTLGRQYDMITYFLQPFTSQGSQAGSTPFRARPSPSRCRRRSRRRSVIPDLPDVRHDGEDR